MSNEIEAKLDALAKSMGVTADRKTVVEGETPTTTTPSTTTLAKGPYTPTQREQGWVGTVFRFHDGRQVCDIFDGDRRIAVDVDPEAFPYMCSGKGLFKALQDLVEATKHIERPVDSDLARAQTNAVKAVMGVRLSLKR